MSIKRIETLNRATLKDMFAFSLVELMISLITISCIAAAFTPVITKKLKKQDIALSLAQTSEIKTPCNDGGTKYTSDCELCTKDYCIKCGIEKCVDGQYIDSAYCGCKNCSDNKAVIGEYCINCAKDKCIKCQTGYYLIGIDGTKHNTCQKCGMTKGRNNICIDGINEQNPEYCDNPPAGYFCDEDKLKQCSTKYGIFCTKCLSNKCTECKGGDAKYLKADGTCGACSGCNFCKDITGECTGCFGGSLFNPELKQCTVGCGSVIANCVYCDSGDALNLDKVTCGSCKFGYYTTNGKKTCTPCSNISNCFACDNNGKCTHCNPGYYIKNGVCNECKVENCTQCNENGKCLICNNGYSLDSLNNCIPSDGNFNCSDSNFIRIGKLCVTRRNMGDSQILKIPSSVTIAARGKEYCYASSSECCYRRNDNPCINNDSYIGCDRTICNYEAAQEICEKFNYAGKKWRLPTINEMENWLIYAANLGTNGLQLCGEVSGDEACDPMYADCLGGRDNACLTSRTWSGTEPDTLTAYVKRYNSTGYGNQTYWRSYVTSVRCVTEME